ncbi:MAG: plasmid pRiA4b ORF-3 family protein [Pseudobdellovibrionaceae bacterium]
MTKIKKAKAAPKVYEFTVSLEGTSPVVWRKFLAHEIINLDELHLLIQMTMGWEAKHLFEFVFGDKIYAHPAHADEMNLESTEGILLSDVLGGGKEFSYIYDFGDYWKHKVEITNVLEHDPRLNYPACIAGENACPPEDCGGPGGYEELKEVLTGKKSDEKDEMLEWVGGFFSPNTFDPNFVNKHLLWADFESEFDEQEH